MSIDSHVYNIIDKIVGERMIIEEPGNPAHKKKKEVL